ncbi:3-deoxy-D-manno-octulosonic acid transferase [Loktanella sp. D2R18]|uniref:3-deoxy-D-manno-octulosonic acid transferase n=1 Tax=Rhodobacterales TaxID=204455 RepID=UPI000DEB92F1|nr:MULTISPECIES: glycosyltransferase N-terminal domain-containing protein [Rhodobacterales]MDO6590144.1 glycosyltransferase N-terminal domain-containing protein [Yoonia sp. 1_MG-2023]RBW45743.1 3-deoxy-D-manno-octulosonic acid transferase [Loktanella sp. D2R18]
MSEFPPPKLRIALILYGVLWWLLLPFALLYLRRRGTKDPDYARHISERFGRYQQGVKHPVWVHAVSLGEMRSATPLIRALLARGEVVLTTHFTPAGRREALREFGPEIASGQVQTVWVPFELGFAYRRFIRHFTPKYGLVMEIEIWPRMIMACRNHSVPLFMCNAQYPQKSFDKDTKGLGLRAALLAGFAGGFVKSDDQRSRFAAAGMTNIHITGELRFDQPIPQAHLNTGNAARAALAKGRPSFTLTSVVEGEDAIYIDMIQQTPGVFFTYVPRAPERFDEVARMLDDAGIRFARRSDILDADLNLKADTSDIDVLLGDSMGEMYFYLSLADRAIVGGGFVTKGAHNIIEPLALKKPVIVGPHIWTIAYPAQEAIAAGVCDNVQTADDLLKAVQHPAPVSDAQITRFYDDHAGGVDRTIAAIDRAL